MLLMPNSYFANIANIFDNSGFGALVRLHFVFPEIDYLTSIPPLSLKRLKTIPNLSICQRANWGLWSVCVSTLWSLSLP